MINKQIQQYRPREAAQRMGIAVSTFWAWAKNDPDFPPLTRMGHTTSVSAASLDAYIASKTGGAK